MARPHRIDYPGAFHHVMNRGAAKQPIFVEDYDRRDFTDHWQEAVSRFGLVVLAYAWMGNHFHALVVSPDGQLSETLRYISFRYTQRFNRRHGRDGALFRGRFNSVLIDTNTYLDRVARYVERNPLDAGIVSASDLPRYEWSSLHHYLGPHSDDWLTTDLLLNRIGSRHRYLSYVLSDRPDAELNRFFQRDLPEKVVLGDQQFVDSLPAAARILNPIAGIPSISFEELEHAIAQIRGPQSFDLLSRRTAVLLGQQLTRATRTELADRYGFPSAQAVSNSLTRSRQSPEVEALCGAVLSYLERPTHGVRIA